MKHFLSDVPTEKLAQVMGDIQAENPDANAWARLQHDGRWFVIWNGFGESFDLAHTLSNV